MWYFIKMNLYIYIIPILEGCCKITIQLGPTNPSHKITPTPNCFQHLWTYIVIKLGPTNPSHKITPNPNCFQHLWTYIIVIKVVMFVFCVCILHRKFQLLPDRARPSWPNLQASKYQGFATKGREKNRSNNQTYNPGND